MQRSEVGKFCAPVPFLCPEKEPVSHFGTQIGTGMAVPCRGMIDTMNRDLPKSVKRTLRRLTHRAHQAALRQPLSDLSSDFDRWKKGEIDSLELSERIHQFHQGPAREIWFRYEGKTDLRLLIGHAIHEGLIDKELIPAEVLPYLESALSFYREISSGDRRAD